MTSKSSKALDKENKVEGVRRARQAPDFSKLHKQWDSRLQKGKAISKKPLTQSQPFQLSESNQGVQSFISNEDFVVDDKAKNSILHGSGIAKSSSKPKRATIGVTSRNSQKSSIPVPSVQKRGSLYTNPNNRSTPKKLNLSPNEAKVVKNVSHQKTIIKVPKPTPISSHQLKSNLQDFTVDFECDDNALKSILNEDSAQVENVPARRISQFGPQRSNKSRCAGRKVPFQKPLPNSRYSFHTKSTNSISASKERWSIYSRDSFSTKPDLMTWLKQLAEESKAKRESLYTKPSTTMASKASYTAANEGNQCMDSKISVLGGKESINYIPAVSIAKVQTKFSNTVVGFQGTVDSTVINTTSDDAMFITPSKTSNKISSLLKNDSQLRSILKTNVTTAVEGTTAKNASKSLFTSQNNPSMKKTVGTPIRLSAYARKQQMLGLPIKKGFRYEQMGESITSPSSHENKSKPTGRLSKITDKYNATAEQSLSAVPSVYLSPCAISKAKSKRVRWADVQLDTSQQHQDDESSVFHESVDSKVLLHATNLGNNYRSPPRIHQIKYVLPAEQPLEKCITIKSSTANHLDQFMKEMCLSKESSTNNQSGNSFLSNGDITDKQPTTYSDKNLSTKGILDVLDESKDELVSKYHDNILANTISQFNDTSVTKTASKKSMVRPFPEIDEGVINDLISFNDSCTEEGFHHQSLVGCEPINGVEPFQSTLLATPLTHDDLNRNEELSYKASLFEDSNTRSNELNNETLHKYENSRSAELSYTESLFHMIASQNGLQMPRQRTDVYHDERLYASLKNIKKEEQLLNLSSTHQDRSLDNMQVCNTSQNPNQLITGLKSEATKLSSSVPNVTTTDVTRYDALPHDKTDMLASKLRATNENQIFNARSELMKKEVVHQQIQGLDNDHVTISKLQMKNNQTLKMFGENLVNIRSPSMNKFPEASNVFLSSVYPDKPLENVNSILRPSSLALQLNHVEEIRSTQPETCVHSLPSNTDKNGYILSHIQNSHVIKSATLGSLLPSTSLNSVASNADQRDSKLCSSSSVSAINTKQLHSILATSSISKPNSAVSSNDVLYNRDKRFMSNQVLKPSILASCLANQTASNQQPIQQPKQVTIPQNVIFYNPMKNIATDHTIQPLPNVNSDNQTAQLPLPNINPVNQTANLILPNNNSVNQTLSDSTFFGDDDDTDVCMIFSKNTMRSPLLQAARFSPVVTKASESHLTQVGKKHHSKDENDMKISNKILIGTNSAFKRLPATCNVFPKNPMLQVKDESKEMAWLQCSYNSRIMTSDSVLDAEVSLCSKFVVLSLQFGGTRDDAKREGATNPISYLLTYGDEKHFVPVTDNS